MGVVLVLLLVVIADLCASLDLNVMKRRTALVVGGGPVGLASALVLEREGWQDVVVLERRGEQSFDPAKGYLYLIDGRGRRMCDELSIMNEVAKHGVSSRTFTSLNEVLVDGTCKVKQLPTLMSAGPPKYWVPRSALLDALIAVVKTRPNIRLINDATVESFTEEPSSLGVEVKVSTGQTFSSPALVIGCDGYKSTVREWLAEKDAAFRLTALPSASAGLNFKIIVPKHKFPLPKSREESVPGQGYAVRGTGKTRATRLSLGLLPVTENAPRTANIIAQPDHEVWKLKTTEAATLFLQKTFPQLDPLHDYFSDDELKRFASSDPGVFPAPSYCSKATMSAGGTHVVLCGDALHSFPPDLGQGVNSGLQDVSSLSQALSKMRESAAQCDATGECAVDGNAALTEALREYEEDRVPEAKALCELMRFGFPYQYRQSPIGSFLAALNFALRLGLNKLAHFFFHPPAFFMVQRDDPPMSYRDIVKLAHRTTRAILKTALVLVALFLKRRSIASAVKAVVAPLPFFSL